MDKKTFDFREGGGWVFFDNLAYSVAKKTPVPPESQMVHALIVCFLLFCKTIMCLCCVLFYDLVFVVSLGSNQAKVHVSWQMYIHNGKCPLNVIKSI